MRELKWTEAENCRGGLSMWLCRPSCLSAAAAQTPGDMWPVEHFLNQRRRELDAKYDYRYSQLIAVFGRLIREGLTEA